MAVLLLILGLAQNEPRILTETTRRRSGSRLSRAVREAPMLASQAWLIWLA
jgi:hypothetical protein